jgi:hypothetical protein
MTTADGRGGFALTPHVIIGIAAIVYGLLLTADNLNWLDAGRILHYWPVALLLVGAGLVVQPPDRSGHRLTGWVLLAVGGWLTVGAVFGIPMHLWDWWPLLFVFMGAGLIMRARGSFTGSNDGAQTLSAIAFWSGVERRIASASFRRAELTAVMGGIEVDLRQAGTAAGEAVIDVFVMWGGIEITVPPDWSVTNSVNVIMGGIEDKSSGMQDAKHHLTIRGVVLMGGVEVKT